MIEIKLTKGFTAIIDDCDADLTDRPWHTSMGEKGYAARSKYIRSGYYAKIFLHRVILERKIGRKLEPKEFCDHINGDHFDNRRDNLRIATHSQNLQNSKSQNPKSGYRGVFAKGEKWEAAITINGKPVHIGTFKTAEEAHKAYREKSIELRGEFARFD